MTPAYVVGFLFHAEQVLLVEKRKPAWQAGLLNGVGGKFEPGEMPREAMVREFYEETGHLFRAAAWADLVSLAAPGGVIVHCFFAEASSCPAMPSVNDVGERLYWCDEARLPVNVIPNLRWLIPLARDPHVAKPVAVEESARSAA